MSKEQVSAVVELVKEDYLVLSLPKYGQALGFAAVNDFNLQNEEGRTAFKLGQQVQARVIALPSSQTGPHSTGLYSAFSELHMLYNLLPCFSTLLVLEL